MGWRGTQAESRTRHIAKFDQDEVDRYESWILKLTDEDDAACLADIARHFQFGAGMSVLDVGAGTGALCKALTRVPGLVLTALEPCPAMIARLKAKPELSQVAVVEGFCDSEQDKHIFDEGRFDVILSRQLVNGLFDPLTAFRNWSRWLKDDGVVMVMDGLYDRSSWPEPWQTELDRLPLSVCQTISTVPYLLEAAGFKIDAVGYMEAVNARPSTRTKRYIVFATQGA